MGKGNYNDGMRLLVPRSACFSIAMAAIEVFPKECFGMLCSLGQGKSMVDLAIAFQLARRERYGVFSNSTVFFQKILRRPLLRMGAFHSHAFEKKVERLTPSEEDLEDMGIGELDIIIRIIKSRSKKPKAPKVKQSKTGIRMEMGRFRMLLRGFSRLKGFDKGQIPLYKDVRLRLV